MILRRRQAVPAQRDGIILRDALAFAVHHAEAELRPGVVLFGGELVPYHRDGVILQYAVTVGVHDAEGELGAAVAQIGERLHFLEGDHEVTALEGGNAFLEAGADRRRRQDHEQRYDERSSLEHQHLRLGCDNLTTILPEGKVRGERSRLMLPTSPCAGATAG